MKMAWIIRLSQLGVQGKPIEYDYQYVAVSWKDDVGWCSYGKTRTCHRKMVIRGGERPGNIIPYAAMERGGSHDA